jgi:AraC-like DNA-binding protein
MYYNNRRVIDVDYFAMVQKAVDTIEENISKKMLLSDLAGAAYCSDAHFGRVFRSIVGVSVMDYVRGRRLSLAANVLAFTPTKVITAALDFGYETPEAFAKAYKRFHGHSPNKASRAERFNYQERAFPLAIKFKMMEGAVIMSTFGSPLSQIIEDLDRESANLYHCFNLGGERLAVKAVDVCEIAGLYGVYRNAKGLLFWTLRKNMVPVIQIFADALTDGKHTVLILKPVKGRDISVTSKNFYGLVIEGNPMLKIAKSVKAVKNHVKPFLLAAAAFEDERIPVIDVAALRDYAQNQLAVDFNKADSVVDAKANDFDVIKRLEYAAYNAELLARNASIEAANGMKYHKGTMVVAYELHEHAMEIAKIAHVLRERCSTF